MAILLLSLSSCGFHLRGSVALPERLSEMTLEDARPATDIAPELRRGLERQGVRLLAGAPMLLQLHGEHYSKRVLAVDASGRAQEYSLGYQVSFSLRDAGGVLWLSGASVAVSRDLTFDANAVLGSGAEETELKQDMLREAVNAIMRRLQKATPPAG